MALEQAGLEPSARRRTSAHGTTVATNALLERRGARTGFVATRGFGDVLALGPPGAAAPVPARAWPRRRRCPSVTAEVDERLAPDGVLSPLDPRSVGRGGPPAAPGTGWRRSRSACCTATRDPRHERRVAACCASELPGAFVVASHELAAEYREYERASTTVVDAYLGPPVAGYLRRLGGGGTGGGLPEPLLMQSSGGLCTLARPPRHPARLLLSGPAGGVAAVVARRRPRRGRVRHGRHQLRRLADPRRRRRPVDRADGGRPAGAAADAGHPHGRRRRRQHRLDRRRRRAARRPAAARAPIRGRPATAAAASVPTVTDANLVLGRLDPRDAAGREPAARPRGGPSARWRPWRTGSPACAPRQRGIVAVANQEMVRAIRVVTRRAGPRSARARRWWRSAAPGRCTPASVADALGMRPDRACRPPAACCRRSASRRASAGATPCEA